MIIVDLFTKLNIDKDDQILTQKIFKWMRYKHFKKGDIVFNYGDIGDLFYIIMEGKVGVHIPSETLLNKPDDPQNQYDYVVIKEGKNLIRK